MLPNEDRVIAPVIQVFDGSFIIHYIFYYFTDGSDVFLDQESENAELGQIIDAGISTPKRRRSSLTESGQGVQVLQSGLRQLDEFAKRNARRITVIKC